MMESEVTGNCHASFGERDAETRLARAGKVRCVPTPLSPLLANIALHGLETAITNAYPQEKRTGKHQERWRPVVIRYADDLVILHSDATVIEACREHTATWLAAMGLELKPSKTRVTHTLIAYQGNVGFDFLGFHIRQYPVGKTHSGSRAGYRRARERLGFKTLTTPSKDAQRRHSKALSTIIERAVATPQATLIHQLNPIIRGWTRYYASAAAKQTFTRMSHLTFTKLWRWAQRRHPMKSRRWLARTYWHRQHGHWSFKTPEATLYDHAQTRIHRHTKVKGARSPYDGDWIYWSTRQGRHPEAPSQLARLLKRQTGRCRWCGLYFKDGDHIERDHVTPQRHGGGNHDMNIQLLHRHCHDTKTAGDGSLARRGTQTPEPPD